MIRVQSYDNDELLLLLDDDLFWTEEPQEGVALGV